MSKEWSSRSTLDHVAITQVGDAGALWQGTLWSPPPQRRTGWRVAGFWRQFKLELRSHYF